ncbi:MAG: hypothetical protein AAF085_11640 [Planctomycetota bacterium]
MKHRTLLTFAVLICCVLLVGCKKNTAFLVVDSETKEPLKNVLVDHWMLQVLGDSAGEPYLDKTYPIDENSLIAFKKPQKGATFKFRLSGYDDLTVRMTKPSEVAERVVYGGPKVKEWIELEQAESEDDKVVTFIVPMQKN